MNEELSFDTFCYLVQSLPFSTLWNIAPVRHGRLQRHFDMLDFGKTPLRLCLGVSGCDLLYSVQQPC